MKAAPGSVSGRAPTPETVQRPRRGRVLLLAPHPDDDILGAGGTCALHVEQGDPVHVLVAYSGQPVQICPGYRY